MQNNRFIEYLKLFFPSLPHNGISIIQTDIVHPSLIYQDQDKSVFNKACQIGIKKPFLFL